MTARHLTLLGCAAGALAFAGPAAAQPEMPYEYAHPAPPQPEVVFRHDPVIQPIPTADPDAYAYPPEDAYEVEYRDEVYDPPIQPDDAPMQPPIGYHDGPPPPPHRLEEPRYEREAWIEDCHRQYRDHHGRHQGAVAGGLVGAAAGGLIGNRVADDDRLAGTLVGAGVGGLAGLAVGSAIGDASDRADAREYCEAMFAHGPAGYPGGQPYPAPYGYPAAYGYGYGYGYPVMLVPVLVQVPQRAVVREYVTEEWVEEAAPPPPHRRVIHRRAPAPAKATKYTKGN